MFILGSNLKQGGRGFTLIELLVVISIIAVLAGGLGVMLKGNNPGAALRGAQSTLMGVLSSARGQAALNQTDAMIIVQADPSVDNFLRSVRVVVETSSGSGQWKEVGSEVILPVGVYIVPSSASITGCSLSNSSRLSDFFESATGTVSGVGINTSSATGLQTNVQFLKSRKFSSLGTISSSSGGAIFIAAGTAQTSNTVSLDNTNAIRGLIISNYGVASLVGDNDAIENLP